MEDRILDHPLTRGAEHLISPGDEAMRILTAEEFVEAQLAYMRANNLIHFPLAGETRDECNRKAQAALTQKETLKKVGEWLEKKSHTDYGKPLSQTHVSLDKCHVDSLLHGEIPE